MLRIYQISSGIALICYVLFVISLISKMTGNATADLEVLLLIIFFFIVSSSTLHFLVISAGIEAKLRREPQAKLLDAPLDAEAHIPRDLRLGFGWISGSINSIASISYILVGIVTLWQMIQNYASMNLSGMHRNTVILIAATVSFLLLYSIIQLSFTIDLFWRLRKTQQAKP